MKNLFLICVMIPCLALAQSPRYASRSSADEAFEARPKETPSVIRWIVSDDPDAECRAASKNRNEFSDRPGTIKACARYTAKTCTIITGAETSHAILGHELRHCFEGRFHN